MINNNEFFLDRITSIHSTTGVVHLQVTTLNPEDGYICLLYTSDAADE